MVHRPTLAIAVAAVALACVTVGGAAIALIPRDTVEIVHEIDPIDVTPQPTTPPAEQPPVPGPAPVQPAPPADLDDDDDDDDGDDD